jgi:hypothetical protein
MAAAQQDAAFHVAAAAASAQAAAPVGPSPHPELTAVRVRRRVTFTIGKPAREWSVLVDGGYVDFLGLGEAVDLLVRPGRHRLAIHPTGARTVELDFAAAAGEVLGFACWSPGGAQLRPQVLLQQELPIRVVGLPPPGPPQH